MALVLKDRVKETTTTTGTSSFSLAGAVTGYDSFGQIGTGNTTYYACYLDGGTEWEVGIGTYTAPSTLSRDTILASSNAGSIVTFSAGQKTIWCDYPAGKAVYLDAAGSISEPIVNISGITGAISTVDTVTFDTGYTTPLTAGQLGWDGNNTLGIGMAGGNVTQHIGEDQFFYCKATSAINKGQVVMFTGAVGASGVPTGAPATGITDGSYIMGIAAENIANNGFGLVQAFGTLRNVNTNGYADGDILWYDPTVTGGLTKTKPSAPNVKVQMAAVINGGSSGGGTILIRINFGSTLGGTDSNAQITSPTGGQTLIYDQTDGYWKNATLTDGTAISITEGASGTITIANTGVTALSAGTGISVSGSTGSVSVTNTAPDQTVSLTAGTGISTTGTYPSFTITNTAPDQVVSITGAGGASVTGTYPSFTITTPSGTVTSVSGTAPIASSGGATPAISISQAGTATDGYLSSTDWNTFNNKQPAGTYVNSVGATSPVTSTGGTTPTIAIPAANGSTNGYLTSSDWTTFNNKGNGTVTSVTGTSPVASSGGATPAISLSSGYGDTQNPYASKTANYFLAAPDGSAGVPTFRAIVAADIPTLNQNTTGTAANVTGTVAIANGGTGQTSAGAAFNALSPITTTGDLIIGNGSNSATRLAIGANGYVLTSNGTTATWSASGGSATPAAVSDQANTSTGYFDLPAGTTAQRPGSPGTGMIRYNTSNSEYEVYNGTEWRALSTTAAGVYTVEYLVVAGGGGGGTSLRGGGGGAGGYQTSTLSVTGGTNYTVTVGAGGASATNGNNSVFSTITSTAGGRGGTYASTGAGSGGSGGGGAAGQGGASGTSGQGNAGGTGYTANTVDAGGGGGGAGAAGDNASQDVKGGNGGNGLNWLSLGTSYAGGGGGGAQGTNTIATGGTGGGGNGGSDSTAPVAGTANTGGGGGGTSSTTGAAGGSGIVIVRYSGSQRGTGGTVTSSGGYTYHTFTSSGTYTA